MTNFGTKGQIALHILENISEIISEAVTKILHEIVEMFRILKCLKIVQKVAQTLSIIILKLSFV